VLFSYTEDGGTSLTLSISRLFARHGLTVHNLGDVVAQNFSKIDNNQPGFIAGHWHRDTLNAVPKNVFKITLLRNPRSQAVSNYLHLCRGDNDQSERALSLGFSGFMKEYPYNVAFQTGSLLAAMYPPLDPRDIPGYESKAVGIPHRFDFVGCLEYPDDLAICLPRQLGFPEPLALLRLNRAEDHGADRETIAALHQEYDELRARGELRGLLAVEARLYETAVTLVRQRRRMLDRARRSMSLATRYNRPVLRFVAADPQIRTEIGCKVDGVIKIGGQRGCGLFGPYVELGIGRHVAAIQLVGPRRGWVNLNISAECGETTLAERLIDLSTINGDILDISADLSRPFANCEVRVSCREDAELTIRSVTLFPI
jgi:hypothetical protein